MLPMDKLFAVLAALLALAALVAYLRTWRPRGAGRGWQSLRDIVRRREAAKPVVPWGADDIVRDERP